LIIKNFFLIIQKTNKKMTQKISLAIAIKTLYAGTAFGQTGVNTETPAATLDVVALKTDGTTAEGVIAPRLDRLALNNAQTKYTAAQTGAIVYVNNATTGAQTGQAININKIGYYYFDGLEWQSMSNGGAAQWFYMPAIVLPTSTADPAYNSGTAVFNVDLNSIYAAQFGQFASPTPVLGASSGDDNLPVIPAAQLEFFVTYYDNTVFSGVAVSAAGMLTYKVNPAAAITDATFMNIVLKPKY
jgi:hypothetical protein